MTTPTTMMMRKSLVVLAFTAALTACGAGEVDKEKIEIGDGAETQSQAAGTIPGNWRLVQSIESAHPYANNTNLSWTVAGSASATRLKVVLTRFELEAGYDFLTINDGNGGQLVKKSGDATGQEVALNGAVVKLKLTSDYSVTRWGFKVEVFQEEPCMCMQVYQPVCGSDGKTYGNACEAACASAPVAYDGECQTTWTRVNEVTASAHPYTNNLDKTYNISVPGAARLRLHFSRISTENGYDYLNLENSEGQLVTSYTGEHRDLTSAVIDGSSVTLRLKTDFSVTRWGFEVDYYEWESPLGCRNDSDCDASETCVQVVCIRAPCPAICQPRDNGPIDVTLEQLAATPADYNGKLVRVTGEPRATAPMCTLMACGPANPCCNSCGAQIILGADGGDRLDLNHADGNAYSCGGNSCEWGSNCDSFMSEGNGAYEFVGRFVVGEFGNRALNTDEFRATACRLTGCGATCANYDVFSRCAFMPEYVCYETASCTAQPDGHCGWTMTPDLGVCLEQHRVLEAWSTHAPLSIPDNNTTGVSSSVTLAGGGRTIVSLSVHVNVQHTYQGDLKVTLVGPDGTRAVLHDRQGGSADNLALSLEVAAFVGKAAAGTWKLEVVDTAAADVGTLTSWGVSVR